MFPLSKQPDARCLGVMGEAHLAQTKAQGQPQAIHANESSIHAAEDERPGKRPRAENCGSMGTLGLGKDPSTATNSSDGYASGDERRMCSSSPSPPTSRGEPSLEPQCQSVASPLSAAGLNDSAALTPLQSPLQPVASRAAKPDAQQCFCPANQLRVQAANGHPSAVGSELPTCLPGRQAEALDVAATAATGRSTHRVGTKGRGLAHAPALDPLAALMAVAAAEQEAVAGGSGAGGAGRRSVAGDGDGERSHQTPPCTAPQLQQAGEMAHSTGDQEMGSPFRHAPAPELSLINDGMGLGTGLGADVDVDVLGRRLNLEKQFKSDIGMQFDSAFSPLQPLLRERLDVLMARQAPSAFAQLAPQLLLPIGSCGLGAFLAPMPLLPAGCGVGSVGGGADWFRKSMEAAAVAGWPIRAAPMPYQNLVMPGAPYLQPAAVHKRDEMAAGGLGAPLAGSWGSEGTVKSEATTSAWDCDALPTTWRTGRRKPRSAAPTAAAHSRLEALVAATERLEGMSSEEPEAAPDIYSRKRGRHDSGSQQGGLECEEDLFAGAGPATAPAAAASWRQHGHASGSEGGGVGNGVYTGVYAASGEMEVEEEDESYGDVVMAAPPPRRGGVGRGRRGGRVAGPRAKAPMSDRARVIPEGAFAAAAIFRAERAELTGLVEPVHPAMAPRSAEGLSPEAPVWCNDDSGGAGTPKDDPARLRSTTAQVTRAELAQYYCRPAKEAARCLGMALSCFKKVCRRLGVPRWPARKLVCLGRMADTLQSMDMTAKEKQDVLVRVRANIDDICADPEAPLYADIRKLLHGQYKMRTHQRHTGGGKGASTARRRRGSAAGGSCSGEAEEWDEEEDGDLD